MNERTSPKRQGWSSGTPSLAALGMATLRTVLCMGCLAAFVGCASTKVTRQAPLVSGRLPRPTRILVHDFVGTAAEVPRDSAMAREFTVYEAPKTAEQIQAGRQLGAEIATMLVAQIRGMGMPAVRATAAAQPGLNDIVFRGYLVSIEEGSAAKRVALGFGAGASELQTVVEGFQMTKDGLRKLGSGEVQAGGSKTPGAALGAATLIATANPLGLIVSTGMKIHGEKSGKSKIEGRAEATAKEIADVLRKRFQEQGWIQ